jgi:hypothetical protein
LKKPNDSSGALPFEAAKPEEILPLLQSGVPRKSRLQCWSPGRKYSYTSRIVKVHETAGLVSISISKEYAGGVSFEADLMRESLGEVLFSLHLPTDVIFFKGEIRKGDESVLNARIKEPLYKVQRRESLRLPVSGKPVVLISVPGQADISAEIVNVSEGGIGVLFREKVDFETVSALKANVGLAFTVFGIPVMAQAGIRHGSEVGSTLVKRSYRLGFSFTDIDAKLKTQLSQLVIEESAKYLGRF